MPGSAARCAQSSASICPSAASDLSAHDFAQMLGAREVILTRAAKIGGAPTVPSRFVQRLAAIAGARWQAVIERGNVYLGVGARHSIGRSRSLPAPRPAPKPPRAARPKRPFGHRDRALAARSLHDLRQARVAADAARRGRRGARRRRARHHHPRRDPRIHANASPTSLPADPARELIELGRAAFRGARRISRGAAPSGGRASCASLAGSAAGRPAGAPAIARDRRRDPRRDRDSARRRRVQAARRRRPHRTRMRTAATSSSTTRPASLRTEKQVRTGLAPQLTLEAAMLRQGGFNDHPGRRVGRRTGLCDAQRRRARRASSKPIDVQGRHAGRARPSGPWQSSRRWCGASTTITSPIARWSIRCGRRATATTIISRASRNGRRPAAPKTTFSGAARR